MKLLYKFVFFMIFFNISAGLVASLNIFSNCLYSDVFGQINPNDPDSIQNISAWDSIVENVWSNPVTGVLPNVSLTIPWIDIHVATFDFSWVQVTAGLFIIAAIVAFLIKAPPTIIIIPIIGSLFYFMFVNSKSIFIDITDSMDLRVGYMVLMIGIGFSLLIIITIMDYIAGQQSA